MRGITGSFCLMQCMPPCDLMAISGPPNPPVVFLKKSPDAERRHNTPQGIGKDKRGHRGKKDRIEQRRGRAYRKIDDRHGTEREEDII